MLEFVDYYEILQVHPRAEPDVIGKAYRTLIARNHPDVGGDPKRAQLLNEAYEVLSDPIARSEYDKEMLSHLYRGGTHTASAPPQDFAVEHEYVAPSSQVVGVEVKRQAKRAVRNAASGTMAAVKVAVAILVAMVAVQLIHYNMADLGDAGPLLMLALTVALFVGPIIAYRRAATNRYVSAYLRSIQSGVRRNDERAILQPFFDLLDMRELGQVTASELDGLLEEYDRIYGVARFRQFVELLSDFYEFHGRSKAAAQLWKLAERRGQ